MAPVQPQRSTFPTTGIIGSKRTPVYDAVKKGKVIARPGKDFEVTILDLEGNYARIEWDSNGGFAFVKLDRLSFILDPALSGQMLKKAWSYGKMSARSKYRFRQMLKGETASVIGRVMGWWWVEIDGQRVFIKANVMNLVVRE